MQGDAIPFTIEDDSAKTVGADGMLGLQDGPAIEGNHGDRFIQAALAIEVKQGAMVGGPSAGRKMEAATDVFVRMRQNTERQPGKLLLLDGSAQDCGVEFYCPIEIDDRNVKPDHLIRHVGLHWNRVESRQVALLWFV
jgi:hypothetical protein